MAQKETDVSVWWQMRKKDNPIFDLTGNVGAEKYY